MQFIGLDLDVNSNKELNLGLFSDLHLDEEDSNVKKALRDMESVVKDGGRILLNGDTGGFILPTDKKRFRRSASIWDSDSNLNDIVQFFYTKLRPFADYIDVIGMGNHEETCMMYNNFNPIQSIVEKLNSTRSKELQPIMMSQYSGFIRVRVHSGGYLVGTYDIYHHHGRGGASAVTKGMIDFSRMRNMFAELYWIGHKHTCITNHSDSWVMADKKGNIKVRPLQGIITPGYKSSVEQYDANEIVKRNGVDMMKGHRVNWSESNFYNHPANGFGRVKLKCVTQDKGSGYKIESEVMAVRN